ncbi:conserved hypothetical protein [Uncinocarpus reesii 1704]|uniref:Urease accessory protein UreF n=1 Tax=Uncinocarpus reesii (strain UAMH 1704) TaxID=336963 RepID=C4JP18_UNCRE|nr:uncharacterized protein UREG_03077 [Uncinocarpus reesii 1704]EEP78232.1 conserved hypothetical protein [Uncinocarpus reesii 1704]
MAAQRSQQELENEVKNLERQLEKAMSLLNRRNDGDVIGTNECSSGASSHSLLLLSDSALPLGAFAYSSGLESYILHHKPLPAGVTPISSFHNFLNLSIISIAGTTLPYVLKAHRCPDQLETLDDDLDASTPCSVARRASVAQGMALFTVWERSFKASSDANWSPAGNLRNTGSAHARKAVVALHAFSESMKQPPADGDDESLLNSHTSGHFGPLWGAVCAAMGVDLRQTAYVFMLNHAKAVVSAAVRASVMGPYQAQEVLAGRALQELIAQRIQKEWNIEPADAGQVAPVIDLWAPSIVLKIQQNSEIYPVVHRVSWTPNKSDYPKQRDTLNTPENSQAFPAELKTKAPCPEKNALDLISTEKR